MKMALKILLGFCFLLGAVSAENFQENILHRPSEFAPISALDGVFKLGNNTPSSPVAIISKNVPNLPNGAPIISQKTPIFPKAVPTSAPIFPKGKPIPSQSVPAARTSAPIFPKAVPTLPYSAPIIPKAVPARPNSAHIIPKAIPAPPNAAPIIPKAIPTLPNSAFILSKDVPSVPVVWGKTDQAFPARISAFPSAPGKEPLAIGQGLEGENPAVLQGQNYENLSGDISGHISLPAHLQEMVNQRGHGSIKNPKQQGFPDVKSTDSSANKTQQVQPEEIREPVFSPRQRKEFYESQQKRRLQANDIANFESQIEQKAHLPEHIVDPQLILERQQHQMLAAIQQQQHFHEQQAQENAVQQQQKDHQNSLDNVYPQQQQLHHSPVESLQQQQQEQQQLLESLQQQHHQQQQQDQQHLLNTLLQQQQLQSVQLQHHQPKHNAPQMISYPQHPSDLLPYTQQYTPISPYSTPSPRPQPNLYQEPVPGTKSTESVGPASNDYLTYTSPGVDTHAMPYASSYLEQPAVFNLHSNAPYPSQDSSLLSTPIAYAPQAVDFRGGALGSGVAGDLANVLPGNISEALPQMLPGVLSSSLPIAANAMQAASNPNAGGSGYVPEYMSYEKSAESFQNGGSLASNIPLALSNTATRSAGGGLSGLGGLLGGGGPAALLGGLGGLSGGDLMGNMGTVMQAGEQLMTAGNKFMNILPMEEIMKASDQLQTINDNNDLTRDEENKPAVRCASAGITCCVPEASVHGDWKRRPLLLNDAKPDQKHCKANFIPMQNSLCATTTYKGNDTCGLITSETREFVLYRHVLKTGGLNDINAVCECRILKDEEGIALEEHPNKIEGFAAWEVSKKKKQDTEKRKQSQAQMSQTLGATIKVAKLLNDKSTGSWKELANLAGGNTGIMQGASAETFVDPIASNAWIQQQVFPQQYQDPTPQQNAFVATQSFQQQPFEPQQIIQSQPSMLPHQTTPNDFQQPQNLQQLLQQQQQQQHQHQQQLLQKQALQPHNYSSSLESGAQAQGTHDFLKAAAAFANTALGANSKSGGSKAPVDWMDRVADKMIESGSNSPQGKIVKRALDDFIYASSTKN